MSDTKVEMNQRFCFETKYKSINKNTRKIGTFNFSCGVDEDHLYDWGLFINGGGGKITNKLTKLLVLPLNKNNLFLMITYWIILGFCKVPILDQKSLEIEQ